LEQTPNVCGWGIFPLNSWQGPPPQPKLQQGNLCLRLRKVRGLTLLMSGALQTVGPKTIGCQWAPTAGFQLQAPGIFNRKATTGINTPGMFVVGDASEGRAKPITALGDSLVANGLAAFEIRAGCGCGIAFISCNVGSWPRRRYQFLLGRWRAGTGHFTGIMYHPTNAHRKMP